MIASSRWPTAVVSSPRLSPGRELNRYRNQCKAEDRMRTLFVVVLLCISATVAHAAGIKFLTVPPDNTGRALKVIVWTPCAESTEDLTVGPYVLRGRRDCPTTGQRLPLVV